MTRQSWVYPSDGSEPYIKGTRAPATREAGYFVQGDMPDLLSPIDGLAYSGRRGFREHNKRHDVVPNADLTGLPTLTTRSDMRTPEQKRAFNQTRKEILIREVYKHVTGD